MSIEGGCRINLEDVPELFFGDWMSLESLTIGKYNSMKIGSYTGRINLVKIAMLRAYNLKQLILKGS
jgi:hypothetical protein